MKRQINWSNVSFTPYTTGTTLGTAIVFNGVTNCQFDTGIAIIKGAGDADKYNSTMYTDLSEPTASITCMNVADVIALAGGQEGQLTATLNDASNGSATGAIVFTLAHARITKRPLSADYRKLASATITFEGYSPDGITNPLTTTITA